MGQNARKIAQYTQGLGAAGRGGAARVADRFEGGRVGRGDAQAASWYAWPETFEQCAEHPSSHRFAQHVGRTLKISLFFPFPLSCGINQDRALGSAPAKFFKRPDA